MQTQIEIAPTHPESAETLGWDHVTTINVAARAGEHVSVSTLNLSEPAARTAGLFPAGVYRHQAMAIERLRDGKDTALTTPTASGKSLVLHTAAAEILSKNPTARILVLYPLRALAEEQAERWNAALARGGFPAKALLLIGDSVSRAQRAKALDTAQVVVATPDIIHAWMMPHREKEKSVRKFLRNLALLAIDEAHAYTAVFGTQAAFLIRRIDDSVRKLGGHFQIAAASATMADAPSHLCALTGRVFDIVSGEHDSSPAHLKRIHFVKPAGGMDLISGLGRWFRECADTGTRFLAFVESRVQAEHFARVAGRFVADDDTDEISDDATTTHLESAAPGAVRAYRSGFESNYRRDLVEQLRSGSIAGLVTTSALELGIDLPDLNLGFIIGAPRSATSFLQRLGRFGRHGAADIFIVDDGSPASRALFENPASVLNLPLQRSTLYLDNPRVQYIHVLCQANEERWDEMETPPSTFASAVSFPGGFFDLCAKELRGESVGDLRLLRPAGDELPHLTYPLRDCDLQFVVKCSQGYNLLRLGTLTFAQVLREAYPGAAYWHAGQCYRVRSVQVSRRTVLVERCKASFTKPRTLPPAIQPDLSPEAVLVWRRHGQLTVLESALQARECVNGFRERRGSAERDVQYPLHPGDPSGVSYANDRFCRHIESTGVLLSHPALADDGVRISEIAAAIEEAFLLLVPIERQDLAAGTGRVRVDRHDLKRGDRFVALYDRTYGSLRLSGHLADAQTLKSVLQRALALAEGGLVTDLPSIEVLRSMANDTAAEGIEVQDDSPDATPISASDSTVVEVIRPGSKGVHRTNGAVFLVESVFFAPDGLRYRGRFDHQQSSDTAGHLPASHLSELPGESEMAHFDTASGTLV